MKIVHELSAAEVAEQVKNAPLYVQLAKNYQIMK